MEQLNDTRIVDIDGSDLYYAYLKNIEISIENEDDQFNDKFSDIVPPNLDFYYLQSQKKLNRKSLKLVDEYYSYDFVNVSFKYPLFLNKENEQIYPKNSGEVATKIDINEIRKHLYLNGFKLNGKTYVRYKRSSGAAKGGSCLFIRKELSTMMDKWSKTGLDESKDLCFKSLTSYEAYKALSLSSIIATLDLNPYNILFVKDVEITLKNQNVIKVTNDCKKGLVAEETTVNVTNNIFDGEGLLDASVFRKAGKSKKGMMLLRSRFFKCCAFNTNLKQWFEDNNITDISQLNGITFAKSLDDIVLVASESCLKYLKMCIGGFNEINVKRWCDEINKDVVKFGVVKTDKQSRFFYGEMVETTYQLLNSLQLKQNEVNRLIRPYIDYIMHIHDLKNTPEFIRFYLEGEDTGNTYTDYDDETEDASDEEIAKGILKYSSYSFKNKVCLELIRIDGRTKNTDIFKKRVFGSVIDSLFLKLYNGRVLVHGTYTTLFGNPYEYLRYIIGKFDKENPDSLLKDGELYCPFFENGEELVGSRAPHTTMGNVLYVKNKRIAEVDRYFNLTKEIVVVDAINNNIQQRLSGCDYDSDSMLLTNDSILVEAAKKNYHKFPVPFTGFGSTNKSMEVLSNDRKTNLLLNQNKIDNEIANNNVGKIVNLSQLLNSHLWNGFGNGKGAQHKELYNEIAILAVLSGAEIDSAKRSFPFNTTTEYNRVRKYAIRNGYFTKKPLFFTILSRNNKRKLKISAIKKESYKKREFKTSMDYLWDIVNNSGFGDDVKTSTIPFFDLFKHDYSTDGFQTDLYKQRDASVKILSEIKEAVDSIRDRTKNNDFELKKVNFNNVVKRAYRKLRIKINTPQKAKLLIKTLEDMDDGYSKLFILLYIIYEYPNELGYSFETLLPEDSIPLPNLRKTRKGEKPLYTLFNKYNYNKSLF